MFTCCLDKLRIMYQLHQYPFSHSLFCCSVFVYNLLLLLGFFVRRFQRNATLPAQMFHDKRLPLQRWDFNLKHTQKVLGSLRASIIIHHDIHEIKPHFLFLRTDSIRAIRWYLIAERTKVKTETWFDIKVLLFFLSIPTACMKAAKGTHCVYVQLPSTFHSEFLPLLLLSANSQHARLSGFSSRLALPSVTCFRVHSLYLFSARNDPPIHHPSACQSLPSLAEEMRASNGFLHWWWSVRGRYGR